MGDVTKRTIRACLAPGEIYHAKLVLPETPGVSLLWESGGSERFVAGPGDTVEVIVQAKAPPAPAQTVAVPPPGPPPLPSTVVVKPRMPDVVEEAVE